MTGPQIDKLTPKQLHFARCVASGMTQAAAYREAFDCQAGSLSKTQQEAASRLMAKDKVRARVDALVRQRERGMLATALSDRERVLDKLRHFIDHAKPGDGSKIRAAELLGKSVGLFKEVIEDKREERTAEDIAQELNERLASYLQKDPETDPELDGNDDTDAAVH